METEIIGAIIKAAKDGDVGRCASVGIALRPCPEMRRCARAHRHPYQFHPCHDRRARPWTARAPEGNDVAKGIDERPDRR